MNTINNSILLYYSNGHSSSMISGRVGQPNHLAIYLTMEYVQQHFFINPEEKNKQGTTGEHIPRPRKWCTTLEVLECSYCKSLFTMQGNAIISGLRGHWRFCHFDKTINETRRRLIVTCIINAKSTSCDHIALHAPATVTQASATCRWYGQFC